MARRSFSEGGKLRASLESAFFNPRVIVALALCSCGVLLGMFSVAATLPVETAQAIIGVMPDRANSPSTVGSNANRLPPGVPLFIGSAHTELIANGRKSKTIEVITLSLTFDHRVNNGVGAASFVREIKEQIEKFKIPSSKVVAAR